MKIDAGIGFNLPSDKAHSFRLGQTVVGQVIAFYEGKPVIKFQKSRPLTAVSAVPLKIGDVVEARVTGIDNRTVTMKLEQGQERRMPTESDIDQALSNAGIKSGAGERELVRLFLANGIPIEGKLLESAKLLPESTGLKKEEVVKLLGIARKLGLTINLKNIATAKMLSVRGNLSGLIRELSDKLPEFKNLLSAIYDLKSVKPENIRDLMELFGKPGVFLKAAEKAGVDPQPILQLLGQGRLSLSESEFAWQEIPLFITGENDYIEFLWKKNKNSEDSINSYMLDLKLSVLGRIIFHVFQKKKRVSLKAYTDTHLTYTLFKKHMGLLTERLSAQGFTIVKSESMIRDRLKGIKDRIFSSVRSSRVDFVI